MLWAAAPAKKKIQIKVVNKKIKALTKKLFYEFFVCVIRISPILNSIIKPASINFRSNNFHTPKADSFVSSGRQKGVLDNFFKNRGYVVRRVDNNIYAGETLANKPDSVFEYLLRAGIETVVDLRSPDEEKAQEYKETCEAFGIEYKHADLSAILEGGKEGIFDIRTNTVKDEFIDNLVTLLESTRKGSVYFGCQHGVDRTNFALVCDYIFNYDLERTPPVIYPTNYTSRNAVKNENLDLVRRIIKRLTPEQRERLNLPDNFKETILKQRVNDIIEVNKAPFPKETIALIEKNTGYDIKS